MTSPTTDPSRAGFHPLRRLTEREYLNTVQELFGAPLPPLLLPTDLEEPTSGFAFHTTGDAAPADVLLYRDAAEALATLAASKLDQLLPCASTATITNTEADCLQAFFAPTGLATRMFRRPLSTTAFNGDVARLTALYARARAAPLSLGFVDTIGLLVEAVLQSAEFLHHWEVAPGATVNGQAPVKLGDYELANRLSYLLWGTMPDAPLFAAAAGGQLHDVAGVEAQIRRMLKDPRASSGIADFFSDWLDLDTLTTTTKDSSLYPAFAGAAAPMAAEIPLFVDAVIFRGSAHFDELMTGTTSFADGSLAFVYGINGIRGNDPQMVALDPIQRSGLLTTAGFLSVTGAQGGSNPPRRGNAIYQKLLCGKLPAPPASAAPLEVGMPGPTTRQRFATATATPCAASCHSIIDPLGFAFENYDGIGVYRTTDNGMPVDASATVTLDGQPKTVANAIELTAALATSDEVQACFAKQWLRYGLGRMDTPLDTVSIDAALVAFKNSSRDVRELLIGLLTSPTFRYRALGTGEVLP